jgi:hypothetical protein
MAIAGNYHFPCIIFLREQGEHIGTVDNKSIENIRKERETWMNNTNNFKHPICSKNCLDVCVEYNNKHR